MAKHHAPRALHPSSGGKETHRDAPRAAYPIQKNAPEKPGNADIFPLYPGHFSEAGARSMQTYLTWPFQAMNVMLNAMADWMDGVHSAKRDMLPDIEKRETEKAYILKIPLPGVHSDQIELAVTGDTLELHVETSEEEKGKGRHYRSSRHLSRALPLPVYIDGEAIEAELKEGVLTVILPKADRPVAPRIGPIELS